MSPFTHFGAGYAFEFQRGEEEQALNKFRDWLKYIGSQSPNRITAVHVHVTLATSRPIFQAPAPSPEPAQSNPVISHPPAAAPLAPHMTQETPAPVVKVQREVFDVNDPQAQ